MGAVMIGIDVGQQVDPTAIAVCEVEPRNGPRGWEDHYLGRHLERLPLGTPYPAVADRLAAIIGNVRAHVFDQARRSVGQPTPSLRMDVFIDATGVGKPVADVLSGAGLDVIPVYFTHGDRRTVEDRQITLGKAWLVSRLKTLLQTGRLHLAVSEEAVALQRELLDYELRVSEDANDRYGAFRVGSHDDLVTALGLAVQGADAPPSRSYSYLTGAGDDGQDDDDRREWWTR